jgi:tetratricopeptide (TPR) repeat protein
MAGITTNVTQAGAWKIQGNINYKQGNYEYALIFYENGLKIDPENTDIINNKSMALIKLGRMDEARQCQVTITRLMKKNPELPTNGSEKKGQCTIKIKGVGVSEAPESGPASPEQGFTEKALLSQLEVRDIEQNIELIKNGIDNVRFGRIKEAKDCQLHIKEMEENIELTKQGLEMVKLSRIEEDKKIKYIEENLDLTRRGLEMIKLGRMKEAAYYNQQLNEIEDRIESTRKNLGQVRSGGTENTPVGDPVGPVTQGITGMAPGIPVPVIQGNSEDGKPDLSRKNDIESSYADPDDNSPVTPSRIIFVIVLIIVVIVLVLTYFNFIK